MAAPRSIKFNHDIFRVIVNDLLEGFSHDFEYVALGLGNFFGLDEWLSFSLFELFKIPSINDPLRTRLF